MKFAEQIKNEDYLVSKGRFHINNSNEIVGIGFDKVSGMYYLNSLMLFAAGLVPLLLFVKKLRFDRVLFLTGWLSWACAISSKMVLLSALWFGFPILSKPDTIQYVTTLAALELPEVLSAYIFLTKNSNLRNANLCGHLSFAAGFGIGEAFTLAILSFLPVDISPSLSTLMVLVERLSLVIVQFGWVALLAYYVRNREAITLSLGVFFKLFSSILTLVMPILLYLYDLSFEISTIIFVATLAAYASVVLLIVLILRRRVEDRGSGLAPFDSRHYFAGIVSFLSLALIIEISISYLHLARTLETITRLLVFVMTTIVLLELFNWTAKRIEMAEIVLGAFIGILLSYTFRLSFAQEVLLQRLTLQAILLQPAVTFLAVLAGIALWRSARH